MSDSRRIDQILAAQKRPIYLAILAGFFNIFFFICDIFTFLPHHIFANPEKKLELSGRDKARPIDGNNSSPWRHVDTIDGELKKSIYPECSTLGSLWNYACKSFADNDCMGTRKIEHVFKETQADGRTFEKYLLAPKYTWKSYTEIDQTISQVCTGLKRMNLKKGDSVVIFAETREEWLVCAIACFKYGCPIVTVYATLGEEAVAYAIKESKATLIFTSAALVPKVAKAIADCQTVSTVAYFSNPDPAEQHDLDARHSTSDRRYISYQDLCNYSDENDEQFVDRANPDDLAVIMYTSGTTGNPKGVMLSHANIMAALAGQSAVIPVTTSDTVIGYLPLAHILEVCAELVCLAKGCRIGYSSPHTLHNRAAKVAKKAQGDCAVLKPTLMACVPAIMDKIFKAVTDEVNQKPAVFRELFRICYERKRARYEDGYESLLVNKIFKPIRRMLGGKLRCVLSGGAPLNAETQRFMNICFCCPVVQGYGLTETCGGGTLADTHDLSTGSVGPPLRCCEIMLREWEEAGYSPKNEIPQGEILISGGNVGIGYYNNPEKTAEDFITIDGRRYFATGDIGEFRADGSLKIIDRKKDLLKLAHGEYISLARVETELLTHSSVDNICVYGSSEKDHLVALIVPNQKNTEALAEKLGITSSWESICENTTVVKAVLADLQKFAKGKLLSVEIPKAVFLCHDPWNPASGLLTEALKLKRKNIEKAFKRELDALYN
uniref:long-chain-fatty-acid--CoA ligase n=1 Tax=Steinernema glaseri TaxID=37863 RepID=A0A1I7Z387_9BILA